MKIHRLIAFLLISISTFCFGCAGSAATNTAKNSSAPSFGIYDISSTANSANTAATRESQSVSGDKLETAQARKSGGGGGGQKSSAANPLAVTVSLDQSVNSQIDTAPTDRKIVRNAELNLEADSPEQAQQKITAIAESKGGFVVESQQSSSDTRITTHDVVTMTVRIPSQKFTEALDEIRKTASRVIIETVKGTDVTEEFIDIEARLKAKKALEQQFVEIMKRANSVDDALSVQSQLAEVRGEIEKIEGRKRFLENQASLSTIKIRLQTPIAFSASSTGFFYRLQQSFSTGFDFALTFVLGLVTFLIAILPFALLIGLPGFLIARHLIRRQNKSNSVDQIVRDEIQDN